jgi:CRP/FNR family transcriptional regulator
MACGAANLRMEIPGILNEQSNAVSDSYMRKHAYAQIASEIPYFWRVKLPEHFQEVFEPKLLREMESTSRRVSLKAGEVLYDIGSAVKVMPLILSGTVKVTRQDESGKELLLYYIYPNESCAMTFTCCMQHNPSEIRATAEDDVDALLIPVTVMDEWLSKYPTWKSFVMSSIRSRFRELLNTIDEVTFRKLDERLVNYLKEKSRISGSALINLSHEQIAGDLATSREVVSRLLKKLESDKKVLLFRNQVKIMGDL